MDNPCRNLALEDRLKAKFKAASEAFEVKAAALETAALERLRRCYTPFTDEELSYLIKAVEAYERTKKLEQS
jgi:hypothetical protein